MRPISLLLLALLTTAALCRPAGAQFVAEAPGKGVRLGEPRTVRYRVGLTVTADGGPLQGLFATVPVPIEWPEQSVRVADEEITSNVGRVSKRVLDNTVEQMLITIPRLPAGEQARVLRTYEITRRVILPPEDTSIFVVPKKIDRQLRRYLGESPFIETKHREIRALGRQVAAEHDGAWEKVEAIYDAVRDKVEYEFDEQLRGAIYALRAGKGDCEELTSLFVACCRVNGIPARSVWVPGHCYAEFYLVDDDGEGHWFPCQPAGQRAFGEMPETRPILQKGDNFRVPEKKREPQRYVAEFLKGLQIRGGGRVRHTFHRELVD